MYLIVNVKSQKLKRCNFNFLIVESSLTSSKM